MSSEYTIRALRDTANDLRSKAAAHYASKEIEARQLMESARQDADAMCASAAEIDADATAKEQQRQVAARPQEPTAPCRSCGNPLVRDELGWAHADYVVGGECPGTTPPVPAQPTAPFDAVPADTLLVSGQSSTVTRTDGEGNGNA